MPNRGSLPACRARKSPQPLPAAESAQGLGRHAFLGAYIPHFVPPLRSAQHRSPLGPDSRGKTLSLFARCDPAGNREQSRRRAAALPDRHGKHRCDPRKGWRRHPWSAAHRRTVAGRHRWTRQPSAEQCGQHQSRSVPLPPPSPMSSMSTSSPKQRLTFRSRAQPVLTGSAHSRSMIRCWWGSWPWMHLQSISTPPVKSVSNQQHLRQSHLAQGVSTGAQFLVGSNNAIDLLNFLDSSPDPFRQPNVVASVMQPLLRGFGVDRQSPLHSHRAKQPQGFAAGFSPAAQRSYLRRQPALLRLGEFERRRQGEAGDAGGGAATLRR